PSWLRSPTATPGEYAESWPATWKLTLGVSRDSSRSMVGRSDGVRFRAAWARRICRGRMVLNKDGHHMIASPSVCDRMAATCSRAQTERRGGAWLARDLLGGKTAPAASCVNRT